MPERLPACRRLTSSPGFRKLPRMNTCVLRCWSAASSFMIGVLSGLYSSVSRRSMSSRFATSRLSSGCSEWKYLAIFLACSGVRLSGGDACDLADLGRHGRGFGRVRIVGHQNAEVPQRLAVRDRQSARLLVTRTILSCDWHPSATIGRSRPSTNRLRTLRSADRATSRASLDRDIRSHAERETPCARCRRRPRRIAASRHRRPSTSVVRSGEKSSVCCQTGLRSASSSDTRESDQAIRMRILVPQHDAVHARRLAQDRPPTTGCR